MMPAQLPVQAFLQAWRREILFLWSSRLDLALVSWIPLLLMAIVSIQLSSGVMRDLPIAVVDQQRGATARELIRRLDASPNLRVAERPSDMHAAEQALRSRNVYAVLLIPRDAERSLLRGETGKLIIFYNASYSTPSNTIVRDVTNVVQGYSSRLAIEQSAMLRPGTVRVPPIAAQTTILFNPQTSYELQLVALVHPALLHLIFMVTIVSALGRELRDGTIGAWLGDRRLGNREHGSISTTPSAMAAIAGKLAVYLVIFMIWGGIATSYLAGVRGWELQGSFAILMLGYLAMYLAYTGVALLLVGLTLSMGRALSLSGLYAGASFAFAGTVFPIESASRFAQIWSAILPYTAFAKLLLEQWVIGAAARVSIPHILTMLAFVLIGGAIGLPLYIRSARQPQTWGRR